MPDRKSCLICNSPYAKYHFGAISCRACAAFFRRCATTKKFLIFCNCLTRRGMLLTILNNLNFLISDTQYPCRLCRMEKCVAAGMQESREFNLPVSGRGIGFQWYVVHGMSITKSMRIWKRENQPNLLDLESR